MNSFDLDLVERILLTENSKRKIVSATLYLLGDEAHNNTTIIINNTFIKNHLVACYGGSFWAIPTLEIKYLIGGENFFRIFDVNKFVNEEDFDCDCIDTWLQNTKIYEKLGLKLEDI